MVHRTRVLPFLPNPEMPEPSPNLTFVSADAPQVPSLPRHLNQQHLSDQESSAVAYSALVLEHGAECLILHAEIQPIAE